MQVFLEQSFVELFVEAVLHAVLAIAALVAAELVAAELVADELVAAELVAVELVVVGHVALVEIAADNYFVDVDGFEHLETVYFQTRQVLFVHYTEYTVHFAQHNLARVIGNR